MKYRCDVTTEGRDAAKQWASRCPNAAVIAFEYTSRDGVELVQFCVEHAPNDWSQFQRVYRIKNDELVETGISKMDREEIRDYAKEAIKRWEERKADEKWLREIGVRP